MIINVQIIQINNKSYYEADAIKETYLKLFKECKKIRVLLKHKTE